MVHLTLPFISDKHSIIIKNPSFQNKTTICETIGMHLVNMGIQCRPLAGLNSDVLSKVQYCKSLIPQNLQSDETEFLQVQPLSREEKKRCITCLNEKKTRRERDNLTKVRTRCHVCKESICAKHARLTCNSCACVVDQPAESEDIGL